MRLGSAMSRATAELPQGESEKTRSPPAVHSHTVVAAGAGTA
jgi:hypothetical protein